MFDVGKESCPRGKLWRGLLLQLGGDFSNRELHGLDDEAHTSIKPLSVCYEIHRTKLGEDSSRPVLGLLIFGLSQTID